MQAAEHGQLPDSSFDVVLSSLTMHDITEPAGRLKPIDEAVWVLKPGGSLLIADIQNIPIYSNRLRQLGLSDIRPRCLGPLFW